MTRRKVSFVGCVLLGFTALVAMPAHAAIMPFTSTGTSGSLAASARFEMVGGNLQIALTNISSADVMAPGEVLTALFFDLNPTTTLTPLCAMLGAGSTVLFDTQPVGGVVGGEWAYKSELRALGYAVGMGTSSAGFGLFGPGDLFPGDNLNGPVSPDGVNYGITSAGDDPSTGNAAVTGSNPLIQNSGVFTFGVPTGFDPNTDISNVTFQYGAALTDTQWKGTSRPAGDNNLIPEPEPGTVMVWSLLFGAGWAGLRVCRRWGGPVGRQPWSPEARQAIHEIIARDVPR